MTYIRTMNNASLQGWNLNLFVVFEALMSEGHVGRAARRLGLSQPAVSHALAQLRAEVADPLFVRTARGMLPTDRAQAMVGPVREALQGLARAVGPRTFDPKTMEHTFVLAGTDFVEFVLLPKLLAHLEVHAPRVKLQLRAWPHHAVPPALETGAVDVAAGFFDACPPLHRQARLFEDQFVCVVRKNHPQVAKRLTLPIYLKLEHIIVTEEPNARGVVDQVLQRQGRQRSIGLRLSHFLMVPPVVAQSNLAAALSRRVAEPMARTFGLRLFPMPLDVPRGTVSLAWHQRSDVSPPHVWFREQIIKVAAQV